MIRGLFAIGIAVCLVSVALGAREGYYRQPTLHDGTVVFIAEGDLWTVPTDGGVARRLTTHPGLESHPQISPDGSLVAFCAEYEGPTEIYTMPIEGGLPTRRTFEGASSDRRLRPVGWTPSGELMYSTRRFSTSPNVQLAVMDLGTNDSRVIELAQAADGVIGGDSLFFVRLPFNGSVGRRYEGGTIEHIWRFDGSGSEAVELTGDFAGVSRDPMWWNGRVHFVSERDGTLNLWSMDPDGGNLKQHTKHVGWDVLGPSLSNGRIVYQHKTELRLHDLTTGDDHLIPITLASDFDQMREEWIDKPMDYVTSAHISPDGERVALTARGEVFVVPVKAGRRVQATRAPDVRYRGARFMPGGDALVALSDESGEVEYWTLPGDGIGDRKQLTNDSTVLRLTTRVSPDGNRIAYSDKDYKLWVRDIEAGTTTQVDEAGYWFMTDFSWSPDSRWLAYSVPFNAASHGQIRLFDADSSTSTAITSKAYNSFNPVFSTDGQWLYFLSDRHFESVVGSPWGPRQPEPFFDQPTKVYALALTSGLVSPFLEANELMADEDEPADDEEADEADAGEESDAGQVEEKGEEVEPVEIELDGLRERLYEVPIKPGNMTGMFVTEDHLYWTSVEDLHESKQSLKAIEISNEEPKETTITSGIDSAELSGDGGTILIRKGDAFFVLDADGSAGKLDDDSKVDLSDWSFSLKPGEQWRQMFVESWRLMRDYFYDRNMHGVDWNGILEKYKPYVDRVTDRRELSDLIAQMVSELSALHTFVRGGDIRDGDDDVATASLGARIVRDGDAGGFRIEHIYQSDPDEPERRSPLARQDLDIEDGDVITMINGVPLAGLENYESLLRHQAGKQVRLRLKSGSDAGEQWDAIVYPISSSKEFDLRYHEWEYLNRLYVEKESGGRLGYIHLRAMGARNMAEWTRQYARVFDREGLVIDVRYNRGGSIDSWILSRLLRKAWFFWQGRVGDPYWNMQQAFRGHKVTLINEFTASDGEAFSEGFRRLGMGPLIGTRTWGGGIWLTSSNVLVDGGIATAAEFGVYGPEREWIIEGTGVSPDIEVDDLPHETFGGTDAQLDRAIEYVLDKLKREPIELPPPPPGKDFSFPTGNH